MLSVVRAGLNFSFLENLRYGISIGSMYVNLKESEGLVRKGNDFNLIGSVDFGYRF